MNEERLIKVPTLVADQRRLCRAIKYLWPTKAANYVRSELPVRIAHRLRDMQALPYIVVTQEEVARVYEVCPTTLLNSVFSHIKCYSFIGKPLTSMVTVACLFRLLHPHFDRFRSFPPITNMTENIQFCALAKSLLHEQWASWLKWENISY